MYRMKYSKNNIIKKQNNNEDKLKEINNNDISNESIHTLKSKLKYSHNSNNSEIFIDNKNLNLL